MLTEISITTKNKFSECRKVNYVVLNTYMTNAISCLQKLKIYSSLAESLHMFSEYSKLSNGNRLFCVHLQDVIVDISLRHLNIIKS